MILALVLIPLFAGLLAFGLPTPAMRRGAARGHGAGSCGNHAVFWMTPAPALNGWLALDAAGLLFLSITSGLFFVASIYAAGYLGRGGNRQTPTPRKVCCSTTRPRPFSSAACFCFWRR